ncbi:CapA family protein [Blautia hansenii]|uniref:Bacterial capsule synthesis protein n=1 Tax=Blautia hansenii DSM 20583 TaxID=537007 RepID=C9L9H2_BLAHA|nr:CapA family protein [Blautia hansenii]ASM70599.1 capsular biosynthesis protein [Blautia hansenii DSM 20583]EEX21318.1 bacterial capsule synthesis protein [Blautia hansenii DSM 20583]UWO10459.1 CapA family protein [Blautia hansenii DSM 20583]
MKRKGQKKKLRLKVIITTDIILLVILCGALLAKGLYKSNKEEPQPETKTESANKEGQKPEKQETLEVQETTITISAAGDCTLGTDEGFNYKRSFKGKYDAVQDPAYFFQNVQPVFAQDDLTIVNMEGTLTEETTREPKQFAFKGDAEYAKILTAGAVETANLANNHSFDYGKKSYEDTITALEAEGISSFGYERTAVMDIKGVKVGLAGVYELAEHIDCKQDLLDNIASLKEQGAQIIIVSFHWGQEKENVPNDVQVELAHAAVDNGADLVLGHHPHVLQGIEEYKGKNIVYSLGNFCFGGNSAPSDMDTMIFQQTFTVKDGKLQEDNVTNILPCKISSAYEEGYNNYQPILAEGDQKEKIFERLSEYSQKAQEAGDRLAQESAVQDKDENSENGGE